MRASRTLAALLGVAMSVSLAAASAVADTGPVARSRLANGMTVLVRENPTAPVVAGSLMIKMGTRWETRETAGISNFLQLMVVRGTTSLDGTQIVEAADRMGGSIDAYAEADYAEIAATALDRYWSDMLALMADVALRPSLPDGTVKAVRDFLLRQVRNRADKPSSVALDTLLARTFGDNPYAWDPNGLKESLERADRARAPRPLPAPLRARRDGARGERQREVGGGARPSRAAVRRDDAGSGTGAESDSAARTRRRP